MMELPPNEPPAPRRSDLKAQRKGAVLGTTLEAGPSTRIDRERRRRTWKRLAVSLLAGVLVLVGLVVAYAWSNLHAASREMSMSKAMARKVQDVLKPEPPKPESPFTILLMGADGRPGETQYRADTIILARVDPAAKEVWMISIPRDTKVHIPGHGNVKINAANTIGGPPLVIKTVQNLLGVPINHYLEINFKGFQQVVDVMGGVYINVKEPINDWKAASASPGHRAQKIPKGYQKLDGEHALVFVRSRDYPDADFTRMKNQQVFFKALAQQSTNIGNVWKLPLVVKQMAKYTQTDMEWPKLISVANSLRGIKSADVQTTTLQGEWISPFVITDEEWKAKIVQIFNAGGSFDTSSVAATKVVRKPQDVSVTVHNGAGVSGVAKEASSELMMAGYDVQDVGNAGQFVYDKTLVVYKTDQAAAEQVAAKLRLGKPVASRGMYSFKTAVLVIIGKDWSTVRSAPAGSGAVQ
jgi:LCP family protein required for cell wall assembly